MRSSRKYGIVMLVTFLVILAMPLFSAPAAPEQKANGINNLFFENAEEHLSNWLLRSASESDEFSTRTHNLTEVVIYFECCINHFADVQKVRSGHSLERYRLRLPKEEIYLLNSLLTI